MSEPKWTPGPWKLSGGVRGHYEIENGVYVAGTCGGLRDGVELANAQLMAAAPELYVALAAVESMWSEDYPGGPESPKAQGTFTSRTIERWKAMRAALAKARGEA